MHEAVILLQAGASPRLSRLLEFALDGTRVERAELPAVEAGALQGRRVLFALTTGPGGMSMQAFSLYLWPPSNVPAHTEAEVYGDSLPSHQEYPTGIFLPDG